MPRQPWDITEDMFLSLDEIETLLALVRSAEAEAEPKQAVGAQVDRLIVECLLFSGLRSTEFCKLRLADTPAGHGRATFHVVGRNAREVFLPGHLCELVRAYVEEVRSGLLPEGADMKDGALPFLYHERRRPYERTGLYRRVVSILERAGLGGRASVQLLRHTYGYLAYLRTGGNLLFVQRQLGHAHPMVTMVYADLVPESYEELACRVVGDSALTPRQ